MPNRVTKEVIDGAEVTRFNGNNQPSGRNVRSTGSAGAKFLPEAKGLAKAPAWVRKKVKEAEYRRRYLSDDKA